MTKSAGPFAPDVRALFRLNTRIGAHHFLRRANTSRGNFERDDTIHVRLALSDFRSTD
jgi:hypothetical protein